MSGFLGMKCNKWFVAHIFVERESIYVKPRRKMTNGPFYTSLISPAKMLCFCDYLSVIILEGCHLATHLLVTLVF